MEIRKNRLTALRALSKAFRDFDTKEQIMDRLLRRYRSKSRVLEADDLPAINKAYDDVAKMFNGIQSQMEQLYRVVAAM